MTYSGHVENGVIVLDQVPITLPEGTKVRVELVAPTQPSDTPQQRPTLAEQFKDLIGKAEGLPVDMAENHGKPLQSIADRLQKIIGKAEGLPADAASRIDDYLYGDA